MIPQAPLALASALVIYMTAQDCLLAPTPDRVAVLIFAGLLVSAVVLAFIRDGGDR